MELEHGFTDRLTISGYANFVGHHVRGLEPDFERIDRDFAFQGLSAEFKYNVLSPYKDGFGLTLYAEPGWSRIHSVEGKKGTELELEFKAILQKNFLDDRLIWAANLTFEPEWEKEKERSTRSLTESEWEKELKLEAQLRPLVSRRARLVCGRRGPLRQRLSRLDQRSAPRDLCAFLPARRFTTRGKKWWATLTYQPQLFGTPEPRAAGRALDEYEKRELRMKIGYNF